MCELQSENVGKVSTMTSRNILQSRPKPLGDTEKFEYCHDLIWKADVTIIICCKNFRFERKNLLILLPSRVEKKIFVIFWWVDETTSFWRKRSIKREKNMFCHKDGGKNFTLVVFYDFKFLYRLPFFMIGLVSNKKTCSSRIKYWS